MHDPHHTIDIDEWRISLEEAREDTTDYFLNQFSWRGAHKPDDFSGPKWYPINEEWRIPAKLDRDAPGTGSQVKLETSIGDLRDFEVYGTFVFEVNGEEARLTAYRAVPEQADYDELFVPFKDATSGKETYGAGRYLDIPRHNHDHDHGHEDDVDQYMLDFNSAYNPLCAYTPRYNCPYPPPQNRLKVAIEAGEKIPFEHE
jgi:uncharacterized protein (DUF1684 family)